MFNINGINWQVYLVPANSIFLQKDNGEFALGVCDNYTKNIYINQHLPCFKKKKVLCHEIAHAAMYSYNVILDDYTEELLADLFATYGDEIIYLSNINSNC